MQLLNKGRLRLLITDSCNLACSYCHNEGQFGAGHFMTVPEAEELADWLIKNEVEVKNLIISGGEPSIHPHLISIVKALRPAAMKMSMVTNGVMLDEGRLDALADAGMTYVKFGIDAVDAQTTKGPLERIPRKDMRKKVLQNALYAADIMPGSHLNTVVSSFNEGRVRSLIQWCDDNRIGVKFLELIEVRPEIHSINLASARGAHTWFVGLFESVRDILSDVTYNPEVMKFYAQTASGQTVQFSENFCRFGACSQLWTRVDSSRRLVPCIQRPVTRTFPLEDSGVGAVQSVNEDMRAKTRWPCGVEEAPASVDGSYPLTLSDGTKVDLPVTGRTGCVS